jgi:spore germination protein YaaH
MRVGVWAALWALMPLGVAAAPASMAYYTGRASLPSMQAEAGVLSVVATDLFAVDAEGHITGKLPAAPRKAAKAEGIALLAVVSNYGAHGFSPKIATAIITPGAAQAAAIASMLAVAQNGVAGINLDFESVPHAQRANYTAFVQTLATTLHAAGKTLVLSLPAETKDDPKDGWTGAYDFAALGAIADTLQVMTYDENGPWGPPGPVAGLDWMTDCLTFTETVVPLTKISLGFPAYGYDWNLTAGTGASVNWNQIPALLAKTRATPQWDSPSSSPWFTYTAKDGASHVVWYENTESMTLKAALAEAQSVASVSVWALGLDDPSYWQAIATGFGSDAAKVAGADTRRPAKERYALP